MFLLLLLVTTLTEVEIELRATKVTTLTTHATHSTHTTTEELTENVVKVLVLEIHASTLSSLLLLVTPHAFLALHIVDLALFGVAQNFIRVGNFLKLLLRAFRVIWVLVWVILDCLFFESFFNLIICSSLLDTHKFVVICLLIFYLSFLLLLLLLSLLLLLPLSFLLCVDR